MRGAILISIALAGCSIDAGGTAEGVAVDAFVATDTTVVAADSLFPIDDTASEDSAADSVIAAEDTADSAPPEDTCPVCPALATCAGSACECPKNSVECAGRCVDLQADPGRCGVCDGTSACAAGSFCAKGACVCQPKLTLCAGLCVDTKGHANFCGGCAESDKCAPNQRCKDGTCVNESSSTCPMARPDECPGDDGRKSCFDFKRDPMHCGGCGTEKRCTADQFCIDGVCKNYVVGVACTACPCPTCDLLLKGSKCCPSPGGSAAGRVMCVEATACPVYLP
jgi:hypothetical protein